MGTYDKPGSGSSGNDREEEQEEGPGAQTGVDDFEDGTGVDADEVEDDSDSGSGLAGVAAGAAAGVGSGGSGGPVPGAGSGGSEISDSGDSGEEGSGDEEDEDEKEEQEQEVDTPEEDPGRESEPDLDDLDGLDEDVDGEEEVDQEEESEEDEEEDDDEDESVIVVQEVDPLSALSWDVQPVMKRVQEQYGDQVDVHYVPAPVREFENADKAKQEWLEVAEEGGMPVDPSFWDANPAESTELVNKGFKVAIDQGRGLSYLRSVWRKAVAEGEPVDNLEELVDLASEVGVDEEYFRERVEEVELESGSGSGEIPVTRMRIHGEKKTLKGRVRYSDFRTKFKFQGLDEEDRQEMQDFIDEFGPVATTEIVEVYGLDGKSSAVHQLQNLEGVRSFDVGGELFWTV